MMKRAALGFRMHSGWGVLVAVAGDIDSVEIVERRRVVVTDPKTAGAIQPYHYAANLEIQEAEKHIKNCAAASERMAVAAIEHVIHELDLRECRIAGAAVLMASGRSLAPLAKVLGAHPLIHTAEGEFFRAAVRNACVRLKITVADIRERDVEERMKAAFGNSAGRLQRRLETAGKAIGPPWTKDHKSAAQAAFLVLSRVSVQ